MIENKSEYLKYDKITLYTEVSPQRTEEILNGNIDNPEYILKGSIARCISEIILQETIPKKLSDIGISRRQPIFSTPIPFQGSTPNKSCELLAFETSPSDVYVAEGDYLTQMREFGVFDLGVSQELRQKIGESRIVTFDEVSLLYESLTNEKKDLIKKGFSPLAKDYWNSVIPYEEYNKTSQSYFEPEVLLLPKAPIINIRKK